MARKVENKNMATKREVSTKYKENHVSSPNLNQSTRLTPHQMDEIREKGHYLNCYRKYIKGNKCNDKINYSTWNVKRKKIKNRNHHNIYI